MYFHTKVKFKANFTFHFMEYGTCSTKKKYSIVEWEY